MFKSLRHLTNANPETDEKPTADTSSLRACLESGRSPETGVYGSGDPWAPRFSETRKKRYIDGRRQRDPLSRK